MNLDDLARFEALDSHGMLSEVNALPLHLEQAWTLGSSLPLPDGESIRQVVIVGMGGSAIGGDLLAAYASPHCSVPVIVWRDYDLPAFAAGKGTLVILSSHSGNTEETLSAMEAGLQNEAQLLAITTGGELARRAEASGVICWRFEHAGMPRAAVGFSFGLLLAAMSRMKLIPDPAAELEESLAAMKSQQEVLRAETPVVHNPAKRIAGQLIDRCPLILGAGLLAPVARRWRTQIAEQAKAIAQFEFLPEADHNAVAGVEKPEALISQTMAIFLRASSQHPRNLLRIEKTREILMVEGFNTDIVEAQGSSRLAQQWTSLHYGDYVAYYLAMAYGIDPTPIPAIEALKELLKGNG